MRRRWAALLWTVVVLQVLLVTMGIVFEALDRPASSSGLGFVAGTVVGAGGILAFPAVGALIFWRRPEHPIGWLFCAVNLGWAINHLAAPYAKYALITNPGAVPGGSLAAWFYFWPGPISIGLLILLFLLFPNGRLLSARWRPVAWMTIAYIVVGSVAAAFAPGPIDDTIGFKVDNPAGIGGPVGHVLVPLAGIVQPLSVLLLVAALISLALRQRRSRGQERQQLKWFTSSLILYVVLVGTDTVIFLYYNLASAMPGWASLFNNIAINSYVLIPIAAGIAILRHRLYDIDIVINRTLVYGTLTATLALVYLGSVATAQTVFQVLTGRERLPQLAIVASTLILAALFNPLRRRIQGLVDSRFYRRKYDAMETLAAFSVKLRDEVDLDSLKEDLIGAVRGTVQPAHVSLWLREKEPGG